MADGALLNEKQRLDNDNIILVNNKDDHFAYMQLFFVGLYAMYVKKSRTLTWSCATHGRLQKIETCTALDSRLKNKSRSFALHMQGYDVKRYQIDGHDIRRP